VACITTRDQLLATSFVNRDGKIAVIVMNPTDKAINYNLYIKEKTASVECLPHSISTLIIEGVFKK